MPRFEAQKWLLRPDQDGRELKAYVSSPDKNVAEEAAIAYATALEKKGFALGPGMGAAAEIHATKGDEGYAICIEEKAS